MERKPNKAFIEELDRTLEELSSEFKDGPWAPTARVALKQLRQTMRINPERAADLAGKYYIMLGDALSKIGSGD